MRWLYTVCSEDETVIPWSWGARWNLTLQDYFRHCELHEPVLKEYCINDENARFLHVYFSSVCLHATEWSFFWLILSYFSQAFFCAGFWFWFWSSFNRIYHCINHSSELTCDYGVDWSAHRGFVWCCLWFFCLYTSLHPLTWFCCPLTSIYDESYNQLCLQPLVKMDCGLWLRPEHLSFGSCVWSLLVETPVWKGLVQMMQGDYREDSAVGCVLCHCERSSGGAGVHTEVAAHNVEWVEQMNQGKALLYEMKVDSLR